MPRPDALRAGLLRVWLSRSSSSLALFTRAGFASLRTHFWTLLAQWFQLVHIHSVHFFAGKDFPRVHVYVNLLMPLIAFYRAREGRCPVEQFIASLSQKQMNKVRWVLRLIEREDVVPAQYFKKLNDTGGLWEVRVQQGGNSFRLLGFFDGPDLVVLVSGFAKKTEQTPTHAIRLAQQRRRDYLDRRNGDV
jgi:phage-related protein